MADKKVKELNDADLDEVTGGVRMATKFSQVARSLFGNASNKTSKFWGAVISSGANSQNNNAASHASNVSSLGGNNDDNEDNFVR